MFGFDPTELADWKPAAGMALQVFDVGPSSSAGLFQRLHRPVAVFAAHHLFALGEGFVDGAGQPTATYFDLALRHHRRLLPCGHSGEMLLSAMERRLSLQLTHSGQCAHVKSGWFLFRVDCRPYGHCGAPGSTWVLAVSTQAMAVAAKTIRCAVCETGKQLSEAFPLAAVRDRRV